LTLPASWGIDDLALVLQDKRFTPDGQIDYALTGSDRLNGYFGDRLLVNGVVDPVWHAPQQWVRLRLLNGCNARPLTLRLNKAMPMLQVANEGGLLEVPVARSFVILFPGERAEVLVDLNQVANGEDVQLLASMAGGGMGMGMGMGGASAAAEVTALTMRVALPKQPHAIESPPAFLPAPPSLQPLAGATVRRFNLDGGMMGSAWTIDGRLFDIGRIDMAVPANAVEVWQFTNMTMMAHPMHVHGVRMTLLSRDGAGPARSGACATPSPSNRCRPWRSPCKRPRSLRRRR
jgi:FtsP/CotA-like multicopper oxidase with cupredoxin domain